MARTPGALHLAGKLVGMIPPWRWYAALLLAMLAHALALAATLAGLSWMSALGAPEPGTFAAYGYAILLAIAGVTACYLARLARRRHGGAAGILPVPGRAGMLFPTAAYIGRVTGMAGILVWEGAFGIVSALVSVGGD